MKKWVLNNSLYPEAEILQKELKVPLVFANLLAQRGMSNFQEAKKFFRPSKDDFIDPFLMLNMNKAVDRIILSIERNEKVLVYGDYDVDGTCSVTLMYLFLKQIGIDVSYYQPDRYKEGYGISMLGVDFAIENDVDLIVALDCGVKAIDQAIKLKDNGVDLIICDHHLPATELPVCVAMLNPKQANCSYPFKELCGCAIGFKLIQGLASTLSLDQEMVDVYLDLVAIATAADIVPMVEENRVFVKLGLEQINNQPRKGIAEIVKFAKRKGKLESSDLVFAIGPRINAAGRLGHASMAVELLASTSSTQAKNSAQQIEEINLQRREIDKKTTLEALAMLENANEKVTSVVFSSNWHKGVVGIVASRLIETYYRPTVVLCEDGEYISGSVRSIKGFDVHAVLLEISDVFVRFGGHKYAAGVTLKKDRLEEFSQRFEQAVKSKISADILTEKINLDAVLIPLDLARDKKQNPFPKLFRLVDQLAPFGPGNMRPVFMLKKMVDAGSTRIVGENHLKLTIKEPGGNLTLDGIGFGLGKLAPLLTSSEGNLVDVAFSLEKNEFRGSVSVQLRVRDLVPSNESAI